MKTSEVEPADQAPVEPLEAVGEISNVVEAERAWSGSVEILQRSLGSHYAAWFGRARPVALEQGTFVLAVPSQFVKEWIENRYLELLGEALSASHGETISVVLVTDHALADDSAVEDGSGPEHARDEGDDPPAGEVLLSAPLSFHPKYDFDSFVIGDSNRFAHAAALAVAEAPAGSYNPLFIYGGAGLGKTHLLHAIGRYVGEWHPHLTIRYVSTEQFLNDFIVALQRRRIPEFHRRYRAIDLLLVDDVQFLEGKERFQEEFFHTFNALHPKSQIVITSDRSPKKIPTLEERLRTRFEWGLITDIQPPDLETRLAILRKKTDTEGITLHDEVLGYIADRVQTNIRELEGALIRIAAYSSLTRRDVTLQDAQDVLRSLLPNPNETRITSGLVISVAAEYFGITPEQMCSPSRSRPLVNARQISMYLCRELTDMSLPEIGRCFGGRDHTTVMFAVNKVKQQIKQHETWYEQVRELTARIRQQAARA